MIRSRRNAWARRVAMLTAVALVAGCTSTTSPIPSPSLSSEPSGSVRPSATPHATNTPEPTATPALPLSLPLPGQTDSRRIRVAVAPDLPPAGSGRMVVTVANLSDQRVAEIVLRWATGLGDSHFIAPFEPSEVRIAEGGPPLLQPWTKWVDGPGERGEPAGTTSLGWGPLDPGATLTIPLLVIRRAEGGVAFDLQLLAGEAILTLEAGGPAELRVELP